jgi:CDP-diacylglycerol--glycerol-3-phosphate 3-phosphatidyltransferase
MVDGVKEQPPGGERTRRIVTVPNVICVLRLLGSFVLVALALLGHGQAFLWLFVALAFSDWLDGKLAIMLEQKSVLGARLDSWADAALYAALFVGALSLHGATLRAELGWMLTAVTSYAVSTLAGFMKYGRWPSYHTRAAKTSWLLIFAAVISLFAGWAVWPLRVACVAITLTNLEALSITILSPDWRADVASVVQVLRRRAER